jgi:hypothetical protein
MIANDGFVAIIHICLMPLNTIDAYQTTIALSNPQIVINL